MKHLCTNITSLPEFLSLEAGKGSIAALASTVLNCPTTGLLGNEAMAGTVSSPRTNYSFQVMNGTTTKTLTDGTFMSHKICESNVNLDVNMDGTISSSTCLDISHYDVPLTPAGSSTIVTITENMQPTGFHFGTIRFTPPSLSPNNDAQNLMTLDASSSTITLDMKNDTDGMIMLHVYDFRNATSSSTTTASTGTTTPGTGSTTPGTSGQGTSTPPTLSLQDQITALTARVHLLETQIALLLGTNSDEDSNTDSNDDMTSGTSTPSQNMVGVIDQNGSSVRMGGHIDFGGHHFGQEEHVSIMMNGAKVGEAFTNSTGSFSTGSMSAPSTLGSVMYHFMGQTSGITGTATITVIP